MQFLCFCLVLCIFVCYWTEFFSTQCSFFWHQITNIKKIIVEIAKYVELNLSDWLVYWLIDAVSVMHDRLVLNWWRSLTKHKPRQFSNYWIRIREWQIVISYWDNVLFSSNVKQNYFEQKTIKTSILFIVFFFIFILKWKNEANTVKQNTWSVEVTWDQHLNLIAMEPIFIVICFCHLKKRVE